MALLKKGSKETEDVRFFKEFEDAKNCFEDENCPEEDRIRALDYIIRHKEIYYVLRMLNELFKENRLEDHVYIDYAFSSFEHKPRRKEDFQELFKMISSDNAYLRNAVISFLQLYGEEVKNFIGDLLNSEDRDVRILSVNILGNVRFEDSATMLREFIRRENDVNALMTAIDYLGEIGDESDIELLNEVKERFKGDPYVEFGVNLAIERLKS